MQSPAERNGYLHELARSIFRSWFKDYSHWGGECPDNWYEDKFGNHTTVKRGGSPRPIQEYLSDEGFRWLKIADVSGVEAPYILQIKEHIKPEGIKKTVHLEEGSLVLSNSASPGIPKILSIDSCIHDGWLYFPESEFSNEWLYLYFLDVREELSSYANGSVFQNLKIDIVNDLDFIVPDRSVLNEFDSLIKPLFTAMESYEKETLTLRKLRDGLLPKLMSGEIDVSQIELSS